jgi:hypothetical protein
MLAAMPTGPAGAIVPGMEFISTQDFEFELDGSPASDEDELIHAWRAEQLQRLGLLPALASAFADLVDWHELASLVERGCPTMLALEIVR